MSKNSRLPNWVIECQACLLNIVKDEDNICMKKILSFTFPSAADQLHETREKMWESFPFFTNNGNLTVFPRGNFARLACVTCNSLLLKQEHG